MFLATQEFGSGSVPLFFLFVWLVTFYFSVRVMAWGRKLWRAGRSEAKKMGLALMLLGGVVPFIVYQTPVRIAVVRVNHGDSPFGGFSADKVHEGMTRDEVRAALGDPQDQHGTGDREIWFHWTDSYGVDFVSIRFGSDGRVTSVSQS